MSDSDNNSDDNGGRDHAPSPKGRETTRMYPPIHQQCGGNESFATNSSDDEFSSSLKKMHPDKEQNKKSSKKGRGTNSNFSGKNNDLSRATSRWASNISCSSTFNDRCADRDLDSPQLNLSKCSCCAEEFSTAVNGPQNPMIQTCIHRWCKHCVSKIEVWTTCFLCNDDRSKGSNVSKPPSMDLSMICRLITTPCKIIDNRITNSNVLGLLKCQGSLTVG
jgi:hypothetical protein